MSLINVQNVSKEFIQGSEKIYALKDINLDIQQGEFTVLIGPSGSGKTTLLNCLSTLDTPTTGTIDIQGTNICKLSHSQKTQFRLHKIGFVFQSFNLLQSLTASENIEYVLILQNINKKERQDRAQQILKQMDIQDLSSRYPNEISGGQQQRVAVARALVSNPRIILADEPTANLDSTSAENLLNIMQEMNKKTNITFLFSTHDERVIKKSRRIIQLVDGKISPNEST